MFTAFEMELGHFALDHTWVGAQATKWKTTVGNVPQEAGVELGQLRGGRHLKFRDSIVKHSQSMDKAESIRVAPTLESGLMHQAADGIVSDDQGIQFLDDADRFQAAQGATSKALVGVHFINDQFYFPAFVIGTHQIQGRIKNREQKLRKKTIISLVAIAKPPLSPRPIRQRSRWHSAHRERLPRADPYRSIVGSKSSLPLKDAIWLKVLNSRGSKDKQVQKPFFPLKGDLCILKISYEGYMEGAIRFILNITTRFISSQLQ